MQQEVVPLYQTNTKNGVVTIKQLHNAFVVSAESKFKPAVETYSTMREAQIAYSWLVKNLQELEFVPLPPTED